ncbi:MAG: ABC transporter permease [Planctomycetota bacterium]
MRWLDLVRFAWRSLWFARLRSLLSLLAMAIGVAAVVLLTWLGESARSYIADQFQSLGTNLIIVLPGRNETVGGAPPLLSETPRDLTIDDALALTRIPAVHMVAPLAFGVAPVSYRAASAWPGQRARERECPVLGSTHAMLAIRHLTLATGAFLDGVEPHRGAGVCVLGAKVRAELFGDTSPLGEVVRLGDRRFRVHGVLQPMGTSLGLDVDECVYVAVADALALFNRASLFRILVQATSRDGIDAAKADVRRILAERHGEEDVTILTQDSLMNTFDEILAVLTKSVAGIAAISMVVAGILIMNVMVVSVAQRTREIGLLKAVGARARQIRAAFLCEALMLSSLGAVFGLVVGVSMASVAGGMYPALAKPVPGYAAFAALAVAMLAGVAFGVLPAQRASRLDPVQALSRR